MYYSKHSDVTYNISCPFSSIKFYYNKHFLSILYKTYHFVCTRLFLNFFIEDLSYNVEGGQINIEKLGDDLPKF